MAQGFVMAQVVGRGYSAMFGLEHEADAVGARGPDRRKLLQQWARDSPHTGRYELNSTHGDYAR